MEPVANKPLAPITRTQHYGQQGDSKYERNRPAGASHASTASSVPPRCREYPAQRIRLTARAFAEISATPRIIDEFRLADFGRA
jgi:hypothetical protein